MLGMLDFRDGLYALFAEISSESARPLSELNGSEILIDSRSFVNHCHGQRAPLRIMPNTKLLVDVFDKHGIKAVYVHRGLEVHNHHDLIPVTNAFLNFIETYHYTVMIHRLLMEVDEDNRKQALRAIDEINVFIKTSMSYFMFSSRYQFYLINALRKRGVRVLTAPQLCETQIAYMLKNSPGCQAMAYPRLFLFDDIESIISEVDCENETYRIFKFSELARHFGCSTQMLRKCLLASMVYFNLHPTLKSRSNLPKALSKGFEEFPSALRNFSIATKTKINELVHFFRSAFSTPKVDRSFARHLSRLLDIDRQEVTGFLELVKSGCCLATDNQITTFPNWSVEQSSKVYSINLPRASMLRLFCLGFISEDVARLLDHSSGQTLVITFPRFQSVEITYAYDAYYRVNLEMCVSRMIDIFEVKVNGSFKIEYCTGSLSYLDIKRQQAIEWRNLPLPKNESGYFDVLAHFKNFSGDSPNSKAQSTISPNSLGSILNFLKLSLLHTLHYVDLRNQSFFVPGVLMLNSGPTVYSQDFDEELIIIFELIRRNFFKPSFLNSNNKLLNQQVASMSNLFIKTLANKYIKPKASNDTTLEDSALYPQSFDPFQSNGELLSVSSEEEDEYYDDPEILSNVERKQISVQKSIKQFQKIFAEHLHLGYSLDDFERIITLAFRGNKIDKILLISRFFPFVAPDFHTEHFYGQDSNQFRELIMVVVKYLNNINTVNLLSLLKDWGQLENTGLLSRLSSKCFFAKNYVADAASLIKMWLAEFQIYQVLLKIHHPLLSVYREHIHLLNMLARNNTSKEILPIISRARNLFKRVYKILQGMQKYVQDEFDSKKYLEMTNCYPLFKEMCEFYEVPK
jgi:hypothetical protein